MNEVETITGNLLDFPPHHPDDPDRYIGINNIAHSCNTLNIMGGGIARQIKERYPQAYEADTEFHMRREHETLEEFVQPLGKYSKAEIKSMFLPNGKGTIYNLYTQANIGADKRQVHYEYFWKALKEMQEDLLSFNMKQDNLKCWGCLMESPAVLQVEIGKSSRR